MQFYFLQGIQKMKFQQLPFKGMLAALLMVSLTACNPFAAIDNAANNIVDTTTTTNTTSGYISCDLTSTNTASLSTCITYSYSTPPSCASSGWTQVSSCSGTHSCVISGLYTVYYSGTNAASEQTNCAYMGGTWY